jgi:uncharacterized protein with PQ loop repeat
MFLKFLKKEEKKIQKKYLPYFDEIFYLGAILNPLVALPQAFKIFAMQSAEGVSFITWLSYFGAAIALMIYGLVHKQKPIFWMNFTVLPVHILILLGIFIYN